MARALQSAGFKVTLKRNASTREMRQAIRDFGAELRRAEVGLFYFAGHGVQVKGNNYLVPVGAEIQSEADAEDLAIDATYALRTMEEAQVRVSIVILDACRNAPFARSFRSSSRGLGQMTAVTGSLVAFATAPGSVAADGSGRNGIYTKHLLASLREPDTDVLKVFQRTRAAVVKETDGKQTPWESTSLIGDFYFRPPVGGAQLASVAPSSVTAPVDPSANERTFWESVKDAKEPAELRAYLDHYPGGLFTALAQSRLKALQPTESVATDQPLGKKVAREQAELGQRYLTGDGGLPKDYVEAVRLFRLAANQGDAIGQANLAYMYESGRSHLKYDYGKALQLYRLAANQGNSQGQSNLGDAYAGGHGGLTRDDAEAVRLYRLAANQGYAKAQHSLAFMYENGRGGLARDVETAVYWYQLSARQANAEAISSLSRLGRH